MNDKAVLRGDLVQRNATTGSNLQSHTTHARTARAGFKNPTQHTHSNLSTPSLVSQMTEGLTRRRGGGSPSTASEPRLPTAAGPTRKAPIAGGGGGSGAVEGRAKVAYDPRDFEGEVEQVPRLTIMEEVLLLGLKDKAVSGPELWLACMYTDYARDICHSGTTTSLTRYVAVS